MWCKRCQQDVPGIADGDGATVCARCAAVLRLPVAEPENDALHAERGDSAADYDEPPLADDWLLDRQIGEAERLLKAYRPSAAAEGRWPGALPEVALRRPDRRHVAGASATHDAPQPRGGALAWTLLLVGTAALVCGGVLAAWSLYGGRTALWNLGLPILIGGQASLLIGIVLQVERMWRNGRLAAQRLAEVDHQLSDLQQTTTLLGNSYGGGSSTFFAHLAEGASPHLLLADLKGQMDLLAMKVSRGG
ncbi:MAG: hypothetical protein WD971_10650 [Pirellulales bacterium]